MPRIIVTEKTAYKFDELSEDAKQSAIQKIWDIILGYDWWNWAYDDAKQIWLEITGFDVGRGRDITGNFEESLFTHCDLIIKNHGEQCETYKIAKETKERLQTKLVAIKLKAKDEDERNELEDEAYEEIRAEFEKDILNAYWNILRNEYDYLQSEEAIMDTIEANDYEFDEDGNLI